MSYHRERKPQGVGAIAAAGPAPRSAPAPQFQVRGSNPAWRYFTGRAGLGRMMEERPTRPPPQGGGSGRTDSVPAPASRPGKTIGPTSSTYNPQNTGIVPPVLQFPPSPGSPPPAPLPDPIPPPLPPPPPTPQPPPVLTCTYPYGIVNGQCVLVGGFVPPTIGGGTVPIGGGTNTKPNINPIPLPPVETDDYTVTPPAAPPPPKMPLVPILLIGGGVALGLALIFRKH